MKHFFKIFISLVLLLFLVINVLYASEEACWYKLKNLDAFVKMQCEFQIDDIREHSIKTIKINEEFDILWEGNIKFYNGKNVADGEGYISLLDKKRNKSEKELCKFKNGVLITNIDFIKIWPKETVEEPIKGSGDIKSYVKLPLKDGMYFEGLVVYEDADKIKPKSLEKGKLYKDKAFYYSGEFQNNAASKKGYACIGIQSEEPIRDLIEKRKCPFPATFLDGTWDKGFFVKGNVNFIIEDGSYYKGEYQKGSMHGYGKYIWADGSYYEGSFIRNMREGLGFYKYPDESVYLGEWKNNLKDGYGELIVQSEPEFVFKGNFSKGKLHGEGLIEFSDGMVYIGNFFENNPHGEGLIYFDDNNIYIAKFENGELIKLEAVYETKTSPYAFDIVTSAYASTERLVLLDSLRFRIKKAFKKVKDWVSENKEHFTNAAKGCVAGAAGGAVAGAAGGAVAGAISGSFIPGAGTIAGAGAGVVAGGSTGALSGCFNGALDAFNYSKEHGGKYGFEEMGKTFTNQMLNLENFLYGALGGVFEVAGPSIKAGLESYKSIQKLIKIEITLENYVTSLPVIKTILKISEIISSKSKKLKKLFKEKFKGNKTKGPRISSVESEVLKKAKVLNAREVVPDSKVKVMIKKKNQIKPNQKSSRIENGKKVKKSNCELMKAGNAPICKDGTEMQLHHLMQQNVLTEGIGTLVELCGSEHREYSKVLHQREPISEIEREYLNKYRRLHWKARANEICK